MQYTEKKLYLSREIFPYAFELVDLKYPEEIKGLVSVIIPIYNSEIYLREALDSVMAQTFKKWEAILVNDGSTDKSPEICAEYVKKDSRFKYICKESNEGLLLARKTGLENSSGEFIANLDSDDFYLPDFFEKMFARIINSNNDFVWCDFDNSDGIAITNFSEDKLENCLNINDIYKGSLCNKLIKRSIYAKVLFPETHIINAEDFIQTISIFFFSEHAEFVSDTYYFYRRDNHSTSRPSRANKEKFMVRCIFGGITFYLIAKHYFGEKKAEKLFAKVAWFYFRFYFLISQKAIIHHNIKYTEIFVPSFLRGLKETKEVKLYRNIHRTTLIWACKGFKLPFKIYYNLQRLKKRFK